MADLTVTAANVAGGANAQVETVLGGEALTQGQLICWDATLQKYYKADANDAARRDVRGITRNACAANQPIEMQTSGSINPGATMTAGVEYYASATPGGICPRGDLTTGDRVIRVGYASTTTNLVLDIQDLGVTL